MLISERKHSSENLGVNGNITAYLKGPDVLTTAETWVLSAGLGCCMELYAHTDVLGGTCSLLYVTRALKKAAVCS
jgi:hypothetical protein